MKKPKAAKKTRMFTEFVEHNDWEGEAWSFWIPAAGNEEALATLGRLLSEVAAAFKDDSPYEMGEAIPERDLDVLIKHTRNEGSYMPRHQKLDGRLVLPDKHPYDVVGELYKGGVRGMIMHMDAKRPSKKA